MGGVCEVNKPLRGQVGLVDPYLRGKGLLQMKVWVMTEGSVGPSRMSSAL